MNLSLALSFFAGFFIFFVLSIYEERKNMDEADDEAYNTTNHMIVLFLFFSMFAIILAGASLYFTSVNYVDAAGILHTDLVEEYRPFAYVCFILSFIPGLMLITKVFDILGTTLESEM